MIDRRYLCNKLDPRHPLEPPPERGYHGSMIRTFKTRVFSRWASKAGLTDSVLAQAAQEIRQGLVDADLGGGVVKKRVSLPGHGKRGSARTLVATRKGEHCFFLDGFKKNEKANVSKAGLKAAQIYAGYLLTLKESELNQALSAKKLEEIRHEGQD